MKTATTALIALVVVPTISFAEVTSRARYLMGTVCEIAVEGTSEPERDIEAAFAEAARIEQFLSTWREDSELSALNRAGQMRVSAELAALLRNSLLTARATGGTFNPLVGPLVEAWKTRDDGALPSSSAIEAAARRTQLQNVVIDGTTIALRNGAQFEEGGFGKGYALDRMLAVMTSPRATINFGGQIATRGRTTVAVSDPADRDHAVIHFAMERGSLSTTSGAEKTFEVAGQRFSHIIDPRNGKALPPRGSVSVISADALTADMLSTALYVMGPEQGLSWAEAHGVAAVFIDRPHIRVSASFREHVRDIEVVDRDFKLKD